jgi:hypothetical protein
LAQVILIKEFIMTDIRKLSDILKTGKKMLKRILRTLDLKLVISRRALRARVHARAEGVSMELMYDGGLEMRLSNLIPKYHKGAPPNGVDAKYLVVSVVERGELELTYEAATYESRTDSWIWSMHTRQRRDDDLWITPAEHSNAFRAEFARQRDNCCA